MTDEVNRVLVWKTSAACEDVFGPPRRGVVSSESQPFPECFWPRRRKLIGSQRQPQRATSPLEAMFAPAPERFRIVGAASGTSPFPVADSSETTPQRAADKSAWSRPRANNTGFLVGIDLGSGFVKAAVLKGTNMVAFHIAPMAGTFEKKADEVLKAACTKAEISADDVDWITITGYGNPTLPFPHRKVSPLTAGARGAVHLFPLARTIIDIGIQQSSVVKMDGQGNIENSIISEKCAAGSGWFLKAVARVLGVSLAELGPLSLAARHPVEIGSDCAVFAETEVISRISEGNAKEDIIAGVHHSLSLKIKSLVERVGLAPECVLIGGGGKDVGLVKNLADSLGVQLKVPDEPQIISAIGSVLFHSK